MKFDFLKILLLVWFGFVKWSLWRFLGHSMPRFAASFLQTLCGQFWWTGSMGFVRFHGLCSWRDCESSVILLVVIRPDTNGFNFGVRICTNKITEIQEVGLFFLLVPQRVCTVHSSSLCRAPKPAAAPSTVAKWLFLEAENDGSANHYHEPESS